MAKVPPEYNGIFKGYIAGPRPNTTGETSYPLDFDHAAFWIRQREEE